MIIKKSQNGFTIVELLIATAVFSMVLLGTAVIIMQVTRLYYKGIISSRTQTDARNLLENISRPIQLEKQTILSDNVTIPSISPYQAKVVCIGTTRLTYVEGLETDETVGFNSTTAKIRHAVWKDQISNPQVCTTNPPDLTSNSLSNGVDMLGQHMRLSKLEVKESSVMPGLWNIEVVVLYGDRDLMDPSVPPPSTPPPSPTIPTSCKGAVAGSQWCAKATYSTKVYKRIADNP